MFQYLYSTFFLLFTRILLIALQKDENKIKKNPLHIDLYPVVWCNAQLNLDCSIHLQTQSFNMPSDFLLYPQFFLPSYKPYMYNLYRFQWLPSWPEKLENWIFKMSIRVSLHIFYFHYTWSCCSIATFILLATTKLSMLALVSITLNGCEFIFQNQNFSITNFLIN